MIVTSRFRRQRYGDRDENKEGSAKAAARSKIATAIALSLITACIGYVFGVINDARRDALARVDQQIGTFYGPLYALTQVNDVTWQRFTGRYWSAYLQNRHSYFDDRDPPTAEQILVWRRWIKQVFQPLNEKTAAVIIDHGDQAGDEGLPGSFRAVVAHVEAYRAVMSSWREDIPTASLPRDATSNIALIAYPPDFSTCIAARYRALLDERRRLQGLLAFSGDHPLPTSKCEGH